jgi:hypothetical protein
MEETGLALGFICRARAATLAPSERSHDCHRGCHTPHTTPHRSTPRHRITFGALVGATIHRIDVAHVPYQGQFQPPFRLEAPCSRRPWRGRARPRGDRWERVLGLVLLASSLVTSPRPSASSASASVSLFLRASLRARRLTDCDVPTDVTLIPGINSAHRIDERQRLGMDWNAWCTASAVAEPGFTISRRAHDLANAGYGRRLKTDGSCYLTLPEGRYVGAMGDPSPLTRLLRRPVFHQD